MRIYNFKNDSEFAIILNPKRQTIEFLILDVNGTKQIILFSTPQVILFKKCQEIQIILD